MEYVIHLGYSLPLFLFSSLYILRIDRRGYMMAGMKREKKAATIMGWMNFILFFLVGLLILLYRRFIW